MALDLQQQEELEEVKRIWHKWLKWVVLLLVAIALIVVFVSAYRNFRSYQNTRATDELISFQEDLQEKQESAAFQQVAALQKNYPHTLPAGIATASLGTLAFYSGRTGDALRHYQWVYDHEKNAFLKGIAATDLAKIKMQQGQLQEALELLKKPPTEEVYFLFEDLKGDIYKSMGDNTKAANAYNRALSALPKESAVIKKSDLEEIASQIEAKKILHLPK